MIVLDTNIVLDAYVFNDPAAQSLKLALASQKFSGSLRRRCAMSWRGC